MAPCQSGPRPHPPTTPLRTKVATPHHRSSTSSSSSARTAASTTSSPRTSPQSAASRCGTCSPKALSSATARPARTSRAQQQAAADPGGDTFLLSPPKSTFPKGVLPAPLTGGPKDSYITGDSVALAKASENGLPDDYYPSLVTGGTGQDSKVPDARIKNVDALPTGPFQLTNSNT